MFLKFTGVPIVFNPTENFFGSGDRFFGGFPFPWLVARVTPPAPSRCQGLVLLNPRIAIHNGTVGLRFTKLATPEVSLSGRYRVTHRAIVPASVEKKGETPPTVNLF